ncbi:hypothetical protein Tco_1015435 [Tanacetum coccineum]|uniref:Uncharacterized protein n=1 Tax=Tanacetum coccineum TaxID=301880 RepID=A0ABQ5FKX1_9ASTR
MSAMPTPDLLAATAKITELEAELRAGDDEEMAPKVEQSEGKKDKKKPVIFLYRGIEFGTWEVEDTNLNQPYLYVSRHQHAMRRTNTFDDRIAKKFESEFFQ